MKILPGYLNLTQPRYMRTSWSVRFIKHSNWESSIALSREQGNTATSLRGPHPKLRCTAKIQIQSWRDMRPRRHAAYILWDMNDQHKTSWIYLRGLLANITISLMGCQLSTPDRTSPPHTAFVIWIRPLWRSPSNFRTHIYLLCAYSNKPSLDPILS